MRAPTDHGSQGRKSSRGIAANTFQAIRVGDGSKGGKDGSADAHTGVRP
jgi:hypothetical protein